MEIRKARKTDIDPLMALFDEARQTIAALGIDQWQNGYPNPVVTSEDIGLERAHIVEQNGTICGTFVTVDNGEPTYDVIVDGHWLSGDGYKHYLALHRVAVAVAMRGKGVSDMMVDYAVKKAREGGFTSLRIDTHKGNVVMRRMLEHHGFTPCGTIFLASGAPRVAYERLV